MLERNRVRAGEIVKERAGERDKNPRTCEELHMCKIGT